MRKGSIAGGAALATAVALMFMSTTVVAGTDTSGAAGAAKVKCVGGNSCKGQSECKSAQSDCMGKNSCKGKGYVSVDSEKQCVSMGGHADKKGS
jgi:uncharacterized membrane protein